MSMRTGKDKQRVYRLGLTMALVVGVLFLGQLRQAMAAPARGDFLRGGRAAGAALLFDPFKLAVQPVGSFGTSEEIGPKTVFSGSGDVSTHYVSHCRIPRRPRHRSGSRPRWSWRSRPWRHR